MVLDAAETVLGFLVLIELYMETLRKKRRWYEEFREERAKYNIHIGLDD